MKKLNYIKYISIIILFFLGIIYLSNLFVKQSNNKSYSLGMDNAFKLIIEQSKNKNCDTINIKNDIEEIKLINVDCVYNNLNK